VPEDQAANVGGAAASPGRSTVWTRGKAVPFRLVALPIDPSQPRRLIEARAVPEERQNVRDTTKRADRRNDDVQTWRKGTHASTRKRSRPAPEPGNLDAARRDRSGVPVDVGWGGVEKVRCERGAQFFSAAAFALVGVFLPGCQKLPCRYNCKTLSKVASFINQSSAKLASFACR
jgi:hypothetical protein